MYEDTGAARSRGAAGTPARQRLWQWLLGHTGVARYRTYRLRLLVQVGFTLTSCLIGFQFGRFIGAAQRGELPLPVRPPGVEGYLPISGLMGILDWMHQGVLNHVHPAATIAILIFLGMSFVLRRSFCSWICPGGLVSETLARIGQRLCGRTFRPPLWLDRSLRSVRYLLLAFFVIAILMMTPEALRAFIESPYNRVSDVKMYLFFARIGTVPLVTVLILMIASIFINGAWCRYLCPYGALVGLVSWLSPARIHRNLETCTDCGLCDRVCMARLPVSRRKSIGGVECSGCLDCVAVCPVSESLTARLFRRRVTVLAYSIAVVLLFLVGYAGGRVTGTWSTPISDQEYIERIGNIDNPDYGHPGETF